MPRDEISEIDGLSRGSQAWSAGAGSPRRYVGRPQERRLSRSRRKGGSSPGDASGLRRRSRTEGPIRRGAGVSGRGVDRRKRVLQRRCRSRESPAGLARARGCGGSDRLVQRADRSHPARGVLDRQALLPGAMPAIRKRVSRSSTGCPPIPGCRTRSIAPGRFSKRGLPRWTPARRLSRWSPRWNSVSRRTRPSPCR